MRQEELKKSLELYAEYLEVEARLSDLPTSVGERALDGAFNPVIESVNSTEGAFEHLQNVLDIHANTMSLLFSARNNLEELGLSTKEVDEKYGAEVVRRQEDLELRLAIAVIQSGETVIAKTTEVKPVPEAIPGSVAPSEVDAIQPSSPEKGEDNRPSFSVTFGVNDKGRPAVFLKGNRKKEIDLMGNKYNRVDDGFGRPDIKLAIIKVISEAPEDGISGDDLWSQVSIVLDPSGQELATSKELTKVRRTIFKHLKWAGQNIIVGDGNTRARKYWVNPELRVRPDFQITSEDIVAVQQMMKERAETPKKELSEIDPALVDIADLQLFLGFIDFHGMIAEKHVSSAESETTKQLRVFLDNRKDWIEMLSEVADQVPKRTQNTDEKEVLAKRLEASEKLFNLLGNSKKLKTALTKLEKAQEDDVRLLPIVDILSSLKDFCPEERKLLREIIETRVEEITRELGGSFSTGSQIQGVTHIYHVGNKKYKIGSDALEISDTK